MRTVGNILWLILVGFSSAIEWALVGLVLCVTVIGVPFGVQCLKLASFSLWPFGRTTRAGRGVPVLGALGNILWFVLAGIWIALSYLVTGALLCITIIGIPFGVQAFKLARLAVSPFGRQVVPTDTPNRFT